jgi:diadenosine tetraphosphate (Ap4A) HIT family hydrolase
MKFIRDFVGRELCFNCEFCDVSNGRVLPASGLIYQTKEIVVYHKMDSYVKGVIIIASKVHVPYASNLSNDVRKEMLDIAEIVKNFMIKYGHVADVEMFMKEMEYFLRSNRICKPL